MTSDFCIALHALVFLDHKACAVSSVQLADNICTNAARVRKVMAPLRNAGFVETSEGLGGGYKITADPAKISLAKIAQTLNTKFVEMNWYSGNPEKDCLVSSGMGAIMDGILNDLDNVCIAHLKNTTVADVSKKIFSKKKNSLRTERKRKTYERI